MRIAGACRKIDDRRVSKMREAMAYFSIESAVALILSLAINIWVVSVFAKGFNRSDNYDIGLENAGDYLGKRFGQHMKYIWAVGLLAAGEILLTHSMALWHVLGAWVMRAPFCFGSEIHLG